ncbi:MAG: glycosyltransferase [Candidatus Tectomicrobia bacterium]|nr:glycosyltransferase [Candidatus Tectomicrobia bacterium]
MTLHLLRHVLEMTALRLACFAQGIVCGALWGIGLAATDLLGWVLRRLAPPPRTERRDAGTPRFVSVVIPSFDGRELLARCLPPLRRALARQPVEHEIIVVDNGSTDGTAEFLVRDWPEVRLLRQRRNLGFIGGCNAGAAAARGSHLLFLNNDMVVDEEFLSPLCAGFEAPAVAAVTARILMTDPAKQGMESGLTVGRLAHGRFDLWHRRLLDERLAAEFPPSLPCLYAGGGSSLFSRAAFQQLGGFDRLYAPFYFEDVDLSYRAWQRGWQVRFATQSAVEHQHRGTIGRLYAPAAIAAIVARNRQLFVLRNVRAWRHLLLFLLRLPFGGEPSRLALLAHLRGSRQALPRIGAVLARRLAAARLPRLADANILARSTLPARGANGPGAAAPSSAALAQAARAARPQRRGPRLLILTPHFPYPLRHGGAVRMYHYIRCLARRGYRITLLSFIEREEERAARGALTPFCEHVELILRRQSFQGDVWNLHPFAAYFDLQMVEAIRMAQSCLRYDVAQCEYTCMGIYAPYISPPARTLLVEIDISFVTLWRRFLTSWRTCRAPKHLLDAAATFRAELEICRRFDHLVTMSAEDAALLRRYEARLPPVSVVPNGVSLADQPMRRSPAPPPRLLFVGYFPHPPNVEGILHFARRVWPLLRGRDSQVRLEVVGAAPPPAVQRLGQLDGITVHGYVEDLAPFYEGCAVFVAPLRRGSGTRLKILEAMARGIPVVATSVACEGLGVADGREVWLADGPRSMADRLLAALGDPRACRDLAARARAFVAAHYDYERLTRRYEEVYAGMLGATLLAEEQMGEEPAAPRAPSGKLSA